MSKLRKLASYRRNTKIKVFPSQLGKDKSKLSFLRTSSRFYSALVILEPQIYVVVEQFGRKISRCSAGVLLGKHSEPYGKHFVNRMETVLYKNTRLALERKTGTSQVGAPLKDQKVEKVNHWS